MEIYKQLVSIKGSCVGLGFFDGVHIGHKALITELVNSAKSNGLKSVILTFKENPAKMFYESVKYISTTTEREQLFSELGVDAVVELDFDEKLMSMSADSYLSEIVYKYFEPKYIYSGFNHTFGKDKSGTPKFLYDNQALYKYVYVEIPPVIYNDEIVSSSLIKKYISSGDFDVANKMLGYDFKVEGTVIEGNKIGRTIGYPTANIIYPEFKQEIPYGVYSSSTIVDGKRYKSILNYGRKPTINSDNVKAVAEVYILGFNKDIYGKNIEIYINKNIRSEVRFESVEELKQQIQKDIKLC